MHAQPTDPLYLIGGSERLLEVTGMAPCQMTFIASARLPNHFFSNLLKRRATTMQNPIATSTIPPDTVSALSWVRRSRCTTYLLRGGRSTTIPPQSTTPAMTLSISASSRYSRGLYSRGLAIRGERKSTDCSSGFPSVRIPSATHSPGLKSVGGSRASLPSRVSQFCLDC